ncbi:MAG: arginine deiminase family protein [Thermoplasmata archaeon]
MGISAEWGRLREVLIHRPGIEIDYAMLSPRPFLFERSFKTGKAIMEHEDLEEKLEEAGVRVKLLKDAIIDSARKDREFRLHLEERVKKIVMFYGEVELSTKARNELEKNVSGLDPLNLFHILTLEPSVDLKATSDGISYPTIYSNIPLANLYFMRDQQAVGTDGTIISNMKALQRRKETSITEFVFRESLKEKNIYRIPESTFFEGGDYMPVGNFALIGTGPRTNVEGALSAMNSGLLKFPEVGIVENPVYDFMSGQERDPMINMHLDTYFNISGEGVAVTSEKLAYRAKVSVMVLQDGKYVKERETNLLDYMREKDFSIINLSVAEQLSYSSNFLTISDMKIIAVESRKVLDRLLKEGIFSKVTEEEVKKSLSKAGDEMFPYSKQSKELGMDVIDIDLSELTGGYGGAHCMTAALKRN